MKDKTKKLSQMEGGKKGDTTTKCKVGSWMDSRTETGKSK